MRLPAGQVRLPCSLVLALLGGAISNVASAQETYDPPLTEHGLPNLQGVWNFTTQTPFTRPDSYGVREFLTEAELSEQAVSQAESLLRRDEREAEVSERILSTPANGNTGAVNNFWFENTGLAPNHRTSLIIHPDNGQLPQVKDGVPVQHSDAGGVREIPGQRPVRYTHGGIDRTGPEDRGLSERCLVFNNGPPLISGPYNNNLQIIQNADHVVILTEMGFDARIVPLEDPGFVDEKITLWSGDSRGRFEGGTLVVETRNFTPLIGSLGLRELAIGDASERILTERFIPIAEGVLQYEFTIQDDATFHDRLVATWPITRVDTQIYEYACSEGNYAIRNILRGARAQEVAGSVTE